MSDELSELQREWRTSVADAIKSQDVKMDLILNQLTSMRLEYATLNQLAGLAARVSALEADRSKLVGAMLILQVLGGLAIGILLKVWK